MNQTRSIRDSAALEAFKTQILDFIRRQDSIFNLHNLLEIWFLRIGLGNGFITDPILFIYLFINLFIYLFY